MRETYRFHGGSLESSFSFPFHLEPPEVGGVVFTSSVFSSGPRTREAYAARPIAFAFAPLFPSFIGFDCFDLTSFGRV